MAVEVVGDGPEVFIAMVEVQALAGVGEAVFGEVPDPEGAAGDNKHVLGMAQAALEGLAVELGGEGLQAQASSEVAALARGSPKSGIAAVELHPIVDRNHHFSLRSAAPALTRSPPASFRQNCRHLLHGSNFRLSHSAYAARDCSSFSRARRARTRIICERLYARTFSVSSARTFSRSRRSNRPNS